MTYKIECVLECENHLGEGPVWDVDEGRLYWLDGTGRRVGKPSIWRMDPLSGKVENWSLERDVGAMALRKGGGAVLALDDGFYFSRSTGRSTMTSHLAPSRISEYSPRPRRTPMWSTVRLSMPRAVCGTRS